MSRLTNSKMYKLINLLSEEEFKQFEVWLRSPVFNKRKNLIQIYKTLKRYKKNNRLAKLTKSQLYESLYTGKNYKASYLNNLIRAFTEQIENYLIWSSRYLEKNKKLAYFSELRRRGEQELFFKETEQLLKDQNDLGRTSVLDTAFLFQLQELIYFHPGNQVKYDNQEAATQLLNRYLDTYFLEKKLALLHLQRTKADIKKLDFDENTTYRLEDLLQKYKSPIAGLYVQRIRRTSPLNMATFQIFHESYLRAFDQLPEREKLIFLLLCINDVVILTTKGVPAASRQLMSLYQFGIREKLLLTPEMATPIMFNNIVSVSIQEKELDYLKGLIWHYDPLLPKKWGAEAIAWANLNLAYAEGRYRYVLDWVKTEGPSLWLYKLQYRIIEMMALHELVVEGTYKMQSMDALAMSFRKFVQRNDPKYQFRPEPYTAFIKLTYELTKKKVMKEQWTLAERDQFRQSIEKTTLLYRRDWLIEQLST